MKRGPLKDLLEGKRWPTDLLITVAFSFLSVFIALQMPDGSILRIVFGIPMLLFFPGYAIVSALWPQAHDPSVTTDSPASRKSGIDKTERLVFSVGLSIVTVPVIGLILNYASSMTLVPILVSLLAITVFFSILAWYFRNLLSPKDRFRASFMFEPAAPRELMLPAILVACILVVASTLVYMIANQTNQGQYSEFYLLDQNRMLNNLPNNITVNETATVVVTIRNLEMRYANYTIIAGVDSITNPIAYADPGIEIGLEMDHYTAANISLADTASFQQEYSFSFSSPGRYRVVWNLLIDGRETEYQLHLWIDVIE